LINTLYYDHIQYESDNQGQGHESMCITLGRKILRFWANIALYLGNGRPIRKTHSHRLWSFDLMAV